MTVHGNSRVVMKESENAGPDSRSRERAASTLTIHNEDYSY